MLLIDYWVDLPKFKNYEISFGQRVRHKKVKQIKKFYVDRYGYFITNMEGVGVRYKPRLHQLVALAFIPIIPGKSDVNHKDGDKFNNSIENLEWCTRLENLIHAREMGLIKTLPELSEDQKRLVKDFVPNFGVKETSIRLGVKVKQVAKIIGISGLRHSKPIIDINTGVFYTSAKELGELIDMRPSEIMRRLNGERPNKTPYRYA